MGGFVHRGRAFAARGRSVPYPMELTLFSPSSLPDFGGEAGVDEGVSESSVGKSALSGCRGPNDRENGCLPRSLRGSAPKIRRVTAS